MALVVYGRRSPDGDRYSNCSFLQSFRIFEKGEGMAAKKPVRAKKRQTRARNASTRLMKALRSDWWDGTPGIAAAIVFGIVVGMLAIVYRASTPSGFSAEQSAPIADAQPIELSPTVPGAAMPLAPTAKESSAASLPKDAATAPVINGAPAADAAATSPEPATTEIVGPALPPLVTITGCLEWSEEEYRLSDTRGVNAPKSRSWKSAFLTKKSASVSVVPAANELQLSTHVGQRVAVTGTLIDRQMRVRSVSRVSSSCEDGSRA
jgi:hypothetical protein